MGKTRLALEVAGASHRAFADGVWLVTLAPVIDRTGVPQAVATALGVRDQTTRPALDQLTEHLADWSYDLCSPSERLLWARLSVFTGGFDLDAAEEVCGGEGAERGDVLDLVDRLVSQSVLVRHDTGGVPRFMMLETIRSYGWARLGDLGRREALWVCAWVALLQGDRDAAHVRLAECHRLAERTADRLAVARTAALSGTAALFGCEVAAAIGHYQHAAAALERAQNPDGVLMTLFQQAIACAHAGDHERARALARRATATSEESGDHLPRSYALWALAFDHWVRGELDEGRRNLLAALRLQQGFRDSVGAALMTELLAWIAASKGEHTRAATLLGTAHSIWRSISTDIAAFGPQLADRHDECVRHTTTALREGPFAAAFAEGTRPTVEAAIEPFPTSHLAGGQHLNRLQ